MKRLQIAPRKNYGEKLREQGLSFYNWDNYWKEDACYQFTLTQIEEIEAVTEELHRMSIEAMWFAVNNGMLGKLGISEEFHAGVRASLERNDFSLYGRFDLAYDGVSPPKMLEYNADTPTSLLESAACQWYWMEDVYPDTDQFNSLHDKLVERWKQFPGNDTVHVATIAENEEDWVCGTYLIDTITQAGREAKHINIEDIGWDRYRNAFVDADGVTIRNLFKLYPWEWLVREKFGKHIINGQTKFVEPLWKAGLSCKGLLPILWQLFPNHPNLLPAYFESDKLTSYAKKPLFSREGANVELVKDGRVLARDDGPYGAEGFIYQQLCMLPQFDGRYPIIGSWVVDGASAGMCIREDDSPITTNMSNFVPHFFVE
ncbi:glutathionylspermidine synthase [Herbaspirillum sp. CF444]|uniref:glutathionylspermidine synthase family protein n=1 Tax=Herbaspirillum sp. CF444 TaxID=1144319 RepID=UPI0002724696|nr:glutathionylspermidine synthase family protein [Herbaspirillum sp. CF444]EJL81220.1 glutathionylspermidine synthase [Herbaspirillum sp. CF444]